ncbi:prolyl oligopeptidase family serine peptidase [Burkholderia sp. AU45388]|uniref:alpha/beta hydrolase family protein n=1 Tax=Burkholderia sp. AU45388 TaxID=3059206 RepID=UPI00264AE4EC|nr:prolyl oligopeptidase family serine peptidase [Burkholderia sp. AU45388]MDN7426981.1 prolyl oligopeptidase family serine peptidase [Burkholderia sp. AU45388]
MKSWLSAVLLCLSATVAHAAGVKFIRIPADAIGPELKAAVWTPCADAAQTLTIGPFELKGRRDCPTVGDKLPLVVISHGHGGTLLGHHDLAQTLADAGYVVAAINHPGDTALDMSRADDIHEFVERPVDIKRLVDYMLARSADAARIDPTRIGFFGFSRGGYTGLVLAGGNPDYVHAPVACTDPTWLICRQIRDRDLVLPTPARDPRIKAYVLADPLDEFPAADTVKNVRAPIQLWASEEGGDGVEPATVPALAGLLPRRPEFHVVRNAAHFAFVAPCSDALKRMSPRVCVDANGFDRVAFHQTFDAQALAFFNANLR